MKKQLQHSMSIQKQQGVVLIISLVMLVIITGLGVSAVSLSNNKTQTAGNSMYSMLVYHGAESTLARSVSIGSEKQLIDAILSDEAVYSIPSSVLVDTAETVNHGTTMTSSATITPIIGKVPCPPSNTITSNKYACRAIEITAKTSLRGTGARATHTEARSKTIPF